MTNKKISELNSNGTLDGTEYIELVQSGSNVKASLRDVKSFMTLQSIIVPVGDETTALTTGAAKVTFRMPYLFLVSSVKASLTTEQTSGSILTVDINLAGTSILGTKLTIDNGITTSIYSTPAVIIDTILDDDAEITIDIDQVGDGTAKGLKVTLIGYPYSYED